MTPEPCRWSIVIFLKPGGPVDDRNNGSGCAAVRLHTNSPRLNVAMQEFIAAKYEISR
jgi:hypothetical protein